MKIDFLISKMTDGGAQRVISVLANHLCSKGHHIRIISFRGGDEYDLDPSIERIRLNKKILFNSVVFNGFFQLFSVYRKKKNRPDVISSHIDLLGYLTIPIAKFFRIKIIVSEHTNHLLENTFSKRFLWRFLYPLADAVTILTSFDLNFFEKKTRKLVVMPNPCSFQIGATNDKRLKEIIAVGQLNRYLIKGFDNLLEIAKVIEPKYPDWKFKIIGGGDTGRKFLENRVKELQLKNVEFMGFRNDIREILNNAEIYVLSSRNEGLPMTLLEGMSQGAACIAFDCISGPSDIITHEHDGLLIENQNNEAMAEGIIQLISDHQFREKVQNNAPSAIQKFSIENVGSKWEKLLKEVAKQK